MKKALCLLLTVVLAASALSLPALAEESSAIDTMRDLLNALRKNTATPVPTATPAPETQEPEGDDPSDPSASDPEGDEVEDTEDKTEEEAAGAYGTVSAGAAAYSSADLSEQIGYFPSGGKVAVLSRASGSVKVAFVDGGWIRVVYVAGVSTLNKTAAATLRTTLLLKKAPTYGGQPVPSADFVEVTVTPDPTQTPTNTPTPTPTPGNWRTAPTGLTAALSEDGTKAVLSWTGNEYCTGYAVYELLEDGTYKVLGTVSGADQSSYTTKALDPGDHVLYVKPRNGSSVGTASEMVTVTIPGAATPTPTPTPTPVPDKDAWRAAPTEVTVELSQDGTSAVLFWTGNEYCTGYAIYEQLTGGYQVLGTVNGPDAYTFTTKALSAGKHIFYVKPRNGKAVGTASESVTLVIPEPWETAPTDVSAVLTDDLTRAAVSWIGNEYCTGYAVYELLEDGSYRVLGTVSGADTWVYVTKALEPGEHVFYVKPRNGSRVGDASETVLVTVPERWMIAPEKVSASLTSDKTRAVISWTKNPDCTSYSVYEQLRSGSVRLLGTVKGANATSMTTAELNPGYHTFFVRTRNGSELGFASETATVLVPETNILANGRWGSLNWTLYNNGLLEITGYGKMNDLNSSTAAWRKYSAYINAALLEEGVTSIGANAFTMCVNMTDVAIPSTVTAIGSWAFANSGLTWVSVPSSVRSVGNGAFEACGSLSGVYLASGLISIGDSAFAMCPTLRTLKIPASVTAIGEHVFIGCNALQTIEVNTGNTVYSSKDGVLFDREGTLLITCPVGKSGEYTVPEGVLSIGKSAFYNCVNLTAVTLPSGVTAIGDYAFQACQNLSEVAIPRSVTSIGQSAFSACGSLSDVWYSGTQADWAKVNVGKYNSSLLSAVLHCQGE